MSANQTPTYRPAPVTQRDGSKLANSNCRMASICTGMDYDTKGAKKSTGAKMRTYTTDQSGGTDSGDAKQAWYNGYHEVLTVRDGNTFDDLLADLRAGRLVHIDVWHATVGGPCLSGGGGYGHTMAVLPDCKDNLWLVSDPWCNPAKWTRVSESKLRAGAEEWGRRIYGRATGGRPWPGNEAALIVAMRAAAKQHMREFHAGGREDLSPDIAETGGAQRTMFTTTVVQPLVGPTTGGDMGIYFNPGRWTLAKDLPVYLDTTGKLKITTLKAGSVVTSLGTRAVQEPAGGNGQDSTWRAVVVTTQALVIGESPYLRAILWCKDADMPADSTPSEQAWDDSIWAMFGDPKGRYPCPPAEDCPDCPPVPDVSVVVAEAVEARDGQWREWMLDGSPGQRERSTMTAKESGETKKEP